MTDPQPATARDAVDVPAAAPQGPRRRILLAEDSTSTREHLKEMLESDLGVAVDTVGDGKEALQALIERPYSIVVTDLRMPNVSGMELIQEVQKRRLPVTVIVTTGYGSIDDAVQAMRLGAADFLTKPIKIEHLRLILRRALRERELQDEVAALRQRLQGRYSFHDMLSKSPRMHEIFELIGLVAQSTSTVLIEGETGTGKEQVARAIHEASTSRGGPLVAINCAAVPETLLESELFGHEKGAFTSAISQRKGRFELADGGTLFLDEVGDVPMAMQAKLLRVLQERSFERVGGAETVEVDVRVIAATNRSLQKMVRDGKFREDLYYRLNVIKIELPPLHARPEDIPLLAMHFVQKYARRENGSPQLDPDAMEVLLRYQWPGNVRELENAIERACVTAHGDVIRRENLPAELLNPASTPRVQFPVDLGRPLAEQLAEVIATFEAHYITKALRKTHGHVGRSASICGISRRSMTAKIAQYNIDKSLYKAD